MLPRAFATRNEQIAAIGALLQDSDAPLLVCGDWNLTPWSGWYRHVLSFGLRDGRLRERLTPTWPARLALLGIPIDHCLASPETVIASKRIGPALGSDHRPIVVRLDF